MCLTVLEKNSLPLSQDKTYFSERIITRRINTTELTAKLHSAVHLLVSDLQRKKWEQLWFMKRRRYHFSSVMLVKVVFFCLSTSIYLAAGV